MRGGRAWRRAVVISAVLGMALGSVPASAGEGGGPPPADQLEEIDLAEGTFVDDDGSIFESDIEWLSGQNITKGCSTVEFCPDDSVTRGQMAAFLHRALGSVLAADQGPVDFVDDDGVFAADIAWLAGTGVTRGCASDRFCPSDSVTRGQMAAFLHRALAGVLAEEEPPVDFTDADGSTFEADIRWLSGTGITKGCSATEFCPDETVTRGQMAAFLHRALVGVLPPLDEPSPDGPAPDDGPDQPEGGDVSTDLVKDSGESGLHGVGNQGEIGTDLGDAGDVDPGIVSGGKPDPVGDGNPPAPPPSGGGGSGMPVFEGGSVAGADGDPIEGRLVVQSELTWDTMGWLNYNSLPYSVGQLTMQYPNGVVSSCSGTVVSRKLILTAAHCLFSGGQAATSYWFQADEYLNGWTAKPYWYAPGNNALAFEGVNQSWACRTARRSGCADYQFADYALIVMQPNNGRYPGDVYTPSPMYYLPVAQNYPQTFALYNWDVPTRAIGYPYEGWFGQTNASTVARPWLCESDDGLIYNWYGSGLYMFALGCHHNGGMSGGPVFRTFNGTRYVVGVTSSMGQIVEYPAGKRWYGKNLWAAPLLNTAGDWGFDDLWRSAIQY